MPKDPRGPIQYFGTSLGIEAGVIKSAKGTLRGNHYHRDQEQNLLLIEGLFISLARPLDDPDAPIRHQLVEAGEGTLITPPRIVHASIFLEDSVLVNLVNGSRELVDYDTHTRAHTIVTPEEVAGYALGYGVEL
jgi:hypothetical protein